MRRAEFGVEPRQDRKLRAMRRKDLSDIILFEILDCPLRLLVSAEQMEPTNHGINCMDPAYKFGVLDSVANARMGAAGNHNQSIICDYCKRGIVRYEIIGTDFVRERSRDRFEIVETRDLAKEHNRIGEPHRLGGSLHVEFAANLFFAERKPDVVSATFRVSFRKSIWVADQLFVCDESQPIAVVPVAVAEHGGTDGVQINRQAAGILQENVRAARVEEASSAIVFDEVREAMLGQEPIACNIFSKYGEFHIASRQ